jgi:hypothetical protein
MLRPRPCLTGAVALAHGRAALELSGVPRDYYCAIQASGRRTTSCLLIGHYVLKASSTHSRGARRGLIHSLCGRLGRVSDAWFVLV